MHVQPGVMHKAAGYQVIQATFPAVELFNAAVASGTIPSTLQAMLTAAAHQVQSTSRSSTPVHIRPRSTQRRTQQLLPRCPCESDAIRPAQRRAASSAIASCRSSSDCTPSCIQAVLQSCHDSEKQTVLCTQELQQHQHSQKCGGKPIIQPHRLNPAANQQLTQVRQDTAGRDAQAAVLLKQTNAADSLQCSDSVNRQLFHHLVLCSKGDVDDQQPGMIEQQSTGEQAEVDSNPAVLPGQVRDATPPLGSTDLKTSFALQLLEATDSSAACSSKRRQQQQQQKQQEHCGVLDSRSSEQQCLFKQEQECKNLLAALKQLDIHSGRLLEVSAEKQQGRPLSSMVEGTHSSTVEAAGIVGGTMGLRTHSANGRCQSTDDKRSKMGHISVVAASAATADSTAAAATGVDGRELGSSVQIAIAAGPAGCRQVCMVSELFDPFGILPSQRKEAGSSSQQCYDKGCAAEGRADAANCALGAAGRCQSRAGARSLLRSRSRSLTKMRNGGVAVGGKCRAWDASCKLLSEAEPLVASRSCNAAPGYTRRAESSTQQKFRRGVGCSTDDAVGMGCFKSKPCAVGNSNRQAKSESGDAGVHRWIVPACSSYSGFAGGFYDEETVTMYVN